MLKIVLQESEIKTVFVIYLTLLTPFGVWADDEEIFSVYNKYGIDGALVITSLNGDKEYVHNRKRASKEFFPASTFKILHTLIALEEGVIENANSIIKWDGNDKGWKPWNKDQTLKSAFSLSCIWCYQEFTKKIDNDTYLEYLKKSNYGNKKTGEDLTTFWLHGDLKISVMEQIDFLRNLYLENLEFDKKNYRILKNIMIIDQMPEYTLRSKTGMYKGEREAYGWYVGYIEAGENVWLFASNIEIRKGRDSRYRKKLVLESLKAKGIISRHNN